VVAAGSDRLLNANVITEGSVVAKSSNDKMASGEGNGVDHEFNKTPLQDDPSAQRKPTLTAPTPVPEINSDDTQGNLGSGTLVPRQDYSGLRGLQTRTGRSRSSVVFGSTYVKRRLIEQA
jgi:hypothetical protein